MAHSGYSRIADLYDTYVQVDFDIPFFVQEAKKAQRTLELMSGTGRVSLPLVEAGVPLTCLDRSAEMLDILKAKLTRRNRSAQVIQMDMCELDLAQSFDLVIIPFHSFAEIISQDEQRQALSRIRNHLSSNGRFICTLRNPSLTNETPEGVLQLMGQYSREDGRGTLLFWMSRRPDASDQHIVHALELFQVYNSVGLLESERQLELRYRLISRAEFEQLAEEAGLRVVAFYGDYAYSAFHEGSSPFMIWDLAKANVHGH